jgi:hypothetical protein
MTVEGDTFSCLGVGVRKILTIKAYAVTYCLQGRHADIADDLAKQRYPNLSGPALKNALKGDQSFFDALASAPGDKVAVMHFVRDLSREQLVDAFRKNLSSLMPKASVDKLLAAIPGDVKKGQAAVLRSDGNTLIIDIAGSRQVVADPLVASKLWQVWLGAKSVTPSLKESIARQVANEGAPSAA